MLSVDSGLNLRPVVGELGSEKQSFLRVLSNFERQCKKKSNTQIKSNHFRCLTLDSFHCQCHYHQYFCLFFFCNNVETIKLIKNLNRQQNSFIF